MIVKTIKILHIEDNAIDADLVARELKKANMPFSQIIVNSKDAFSNALEMTMPDIVLSDHSLPSFNSLEAIKIIKSKGILVPFILITGNTSEEFAVSVIKAGADDYVLKDRIQRLPSAIKNAVERFELDVIRLTIKKEKEEGDKLAIEELKKLTERLQLATSSSGIGIWEWDIITNQAIWDKEMYTLYGIKPANNTFIFNNWLSCLHPDDQHKGAENIQLAISGEKEFNTEFRIVWGDGSIHYIKARGVVEWDDDKNPVRMLGANWDITNLKLLEAEKDKVTKAVEISEKRARSFAKQLNDVLEEERSHIAREIHDEFGQQLSGIKMSLSLLLKNSGSSPTVQVIVDHLISDVDNSIKSLRRIANELRPVLIDKFGLFAAIECLVKEFEKKTGISSRVYVDINQPNINKKVEINIFRICQEALTNIAKHAEASEVKISIENHHQRLLIKINDNGKGISHQTLHNPLSMGLLNMKERANLIGAELSVRSNARQGTFIKLEVNTNEGENTDRR
jgi:signal transduction histidine kinase/DNA-binding NarL/FixJ family response regulator